MWRAARRRFSTATKFASLDALRARVGEELGWSKWIAMNAARVEGFADATNDHQWIHVDPERARREGPFGGAVAHGFLSLSLVVPFLQDVVGDVGGATTRINIGLNRVRFISPVMVGDKLRANFKLLQLDDTKDGTGAQAVYAVECWTETGTKPAVLVESVIRYIRDS